MKKKSKYLLLAVCMAGALALNFASPYTLNSNSLKAEAQGIQNERTLYFYANDSKAAFDHIQNTPTEKDNSFEQIRKNLALNKVKVLPKGLSELANDSGATDIALSIEDIRNDPEVKKFVRDAFARGVKVYVYGEGFTIPEFNELLGIDKLAAYIYFANAADEQLAKGTKPEVTIETSEKFQVVGYTNNANEPNQFFLGQIGGVKAGKFESHMYLDQIISNQIDTIKRIENNGKQSF